MHGIIEDATSFTDSFTLDDRSPSPMQITPRKRRPRRQKAVRLCDVAREAGVSIATVSLVLSGNARISLATQQNVRRVARRLGYQPLRAVHMPPRRHRDDLNPLALAPSLPNVYVVQMPADAVGLWHYGA